MGFCIVILALAILSIIFGRVAAYFTKQDEKKNSKPEVKQVEKLKPVAKLAEGEIAPDVVTAIGLALYLANNQHDEESNVITIEHHQTSWNDKNYGVRHWKR